MEIVKNNPVMTLVLAQVGAAVGLLTAFDVHLTEAQSGAIGTFAASTLALGFYVRSKVKPTRKP